MMIIDRSDWPDLYGRWYMARSQDLRCFYVGGHEWAFVVESLCSLNKFWSIRSGDQAVRDMKHRLQQTSSFSLSALAFHVFRMVSKLSVSTGSLSPGSILPRWSMSYLAYFTVDAKYTRHHLTKKARYSVSYVQFQNSKCKKGSWRQLESIQQSKPPMNKVMGKSFNLLHSFLISEQMNWNLVFRPLHILISSCQRDPDSNSFTITTSRAFKISDAELS